MSSIRLLRKPRFLFVYPFAVWLFVTARITEPALRLGIVVIGLGELLRLWANGYVGHVKVNETGLRRGEIKIGQLITAGPYSFVRHPLYLGTALIGAGFCLIVGNWWVSLGALGCFLLLYRRKMAEEEATIEREWGAQYMAYHRRVPRLFPKIPPYAKRVGTWSWQGIAASKEWKTCIWVTVLLIALYFREEVIQEHDFLTAHVWRKQIALLVVALLLMTIDLVAELSKRWTQRVSHVG